MLMAIRGDITSIGAAFDFEGMFRQVEPSLRRAFVAAYGPDVGPEATAEALAWAWEHQDAVARAVNPAAFLYRVGQSRVRRRQVRAPYIQEPQSEPWVEPELANALRRLSERQRVAVVLVYGYRWTLSEVAELLGVRVTTVQNHVERGLRRLRSSLKVDQT